jgi:predicted ATPase/tRNA A-37 threonylcarbamoyl transferase component Bud32
LSSADAPSPFAATARAPGSPLTASHLAPGTLVGARYRVLSVIGSGGMGTVYEAEHIVTGARWALKLLEGRLAPGSESLARFLREARVPAQLRTEFVARVTDAGNADDLGSAPFLVMDLLDGTDLDQHLERHGAMPVADVIAYFRQASEAVAAAHELGIVHRDLKPQNLFLHRELAGRVVLKVLDFGIAHYAEASSAAAIALTSAESVMGTPLYMAPEQASSVWGAVGPTTDVWALGLVAFAMLSGRAYWSAPSVPHLIGQILSQPMSPPSSLVPALPRGFDAWFARSCARDPKARFVSVVQQAAALAASLEGAVAPAIEARVQAERISASGIPVPPTSFVGRSRELSELGEALARTRLVTIAGPGGVGKTRLANELAQRSAEAFPDGVHWIELASVTDEARVVSAIADVVVPDRPADGDPMTALLARLERRSALLVVDNAEHVRAAVARVAAGIVRRTTRAKIVCTSRIPLEVGGELVWTAAPLALPPTSEETLETLRAVPSIELFESRARFAKASFVISATTAPTVAAICRRLDGLPLAIELAAARAGTFSLADLLARLDDRLASLVSRDPTLLPHQRTLLATLEWSFNLLGEDAQRLYAWISVCAGGFGRDAARALASAAGLSAGRAAEAIDDLVRHSLVVAGELDGGSRYRMLDTMREHGRRKLAEKGELASAQQALVTATAGLLQKAGPGLEGPDQIRYARRLDAEHDNLRAALAWSVEHAPETGLKLASTAARFWSLQGHLQEGAEWCRRLLFVANAAPPTLRARALTALGGLLELRLGNMTEAIARLEQARELLKGGDPRSFAWATFYLGLASFEPENPGPSRAWFVESQAIFEKCGDIGGYAFARLMWGYAILELDADASRGVAEQMLVPARGMQHLNLVGHALELHVCANLTRRMPEQEDLARLREAFDGYERLGNRACATHTLEVLAFWDLAHGDSARAGTLFGAADAERRRLGRTRIGYEDARGFLGHVLGRADERELAGGLAQGWAMSLTDAVAYGLRR